jgi:glycosyltransferase involved in cell wall biosynthesis
MPQFSVIIPTRNRRALLQQALASVFTQTFQDLEVIVVDDHSEDDTAGYLPTLGDRVRRLRIEAGSPGAARNAGASVAAGEYLAFLDSDDVWLPWTLAAFADAVTRYRHPAFVCASFRQFDDPLELSDAVEAPLSADAYPNYYATWPRQLAIGAGMIAVRKSEFDRVGGFTGAGVNLEDHDLTLRLGLAHGFVQIVQPLTLGWRRHGHSVTADVGKSVAGCAMLMRHERSGVYPGGQALEATRRGLITTHARAVSLECVKAGRAGDAARIYLSTLAWHLASRRWKYLLGFPLKLGAAWVRPRAA